MVSPNQVMTARRVCKYETHILVCCALEPRPIHPFQHRCSERATGEGTRLTVRFTRRSREAPRSDRLDACQSDFECTGIIPIISPAYLAYLVYLVYFGALCSQSCLCEARNWADHQPTTVQQAIRSVCSAGERIARIRKQQLQQSRGTLNVCSSGERREQQVLGREATSAVTLCPHTRSGGDWIA